MNFKFIFCQLYKKTNFIVTNSEHCQNLFFISNIHSRKFSKNKFFKSVKSTCLKIFCHGEDFYMLFKMEFILNSIQLSTPMKTSIEKYCMFVLPIKQSDNLPYLLFPKANWPNFNKPLKFQRKLIKTYLEYTLPCLLKV